MKNVNFMPSLGSLFPCVDCPGIVATSIISSGWDSGAPCSPNNGTFTFTVFVPGSPCTWVYDKIGSASIVITYDPGTGLFTPGMPAACGPALSQSILCIDGKLTGQWTANNLLGYCGPVTTVTFTFV